MRRGGWWLEIYENSLSLMFLPLSAISFVLHWRGSFLHYQLEQRLAGQPVPTSMLSYLAEAEFWFESFQNWQSEFIAVLSIVVLTIFLRQKDSPESKQVDTPHAETGA